MEFIQIAFCSTVPLLLLVSLFRSKQQYFFFNLLAASNLVMIGYSIFELRQLVALYQFAREMGIDTRLKFNDFNVASFRLAVVILLPFLSLFRRFRNSLRFSVLLLVLLYWNYPVQYWNNLGLLLKIASYCCMLCSSYALLWLMHQLPHQSRIR
ncbi:MAG: hypothetical protein RLZZ28_1032 [Bacteroidota bacterium]|jgi:hypothetical protein